MNKQFLTLVIIRVLQAFAAWFFAFGLINSLNVPDNLVLMVFAGIVGVTVSVVGIGCEHYLAAGTGSASRSFWRVLPVTLIGSAVGVAVLHFPAVVLGSQGLLIPIIGALSAYHFSGR